ncbi:MAG TPA: hypothetical protein VGP93_06200, partial [Polyangiaceae bacterium]|nr:hypothetical protein [Polyangiaceae bacterium]
TGTSMPSSVDSAFQDDVHTPLSESGFSFSTDAVSKFKVAVNSDNQGVRLRRLLDFQTEGQRAEVVVDGASAGIWYSAGSNGSLRWKEDDFWIPAELTAGKTKLAIEIHVQSTAWTEFHYWVASQGGSAVSCP